MLGYTLHPFCRVHFYHSTPPSFQVSKFPSRVQYFRYNLNLLTMFPKLGAGWHMVRGGSTGGRDPLHPGLEDHPIIVICTCSNMYMLPGFAPNLFLGRVTLHYTTAIHYCHPWLPSMITIGLLLFAGGGSSLEGEPRYCIWSNNFYFSVLPWSESISSRVIDIRVQSIQLLQINSSRKCMMLYYIWAILTQKTTSKSCYKDIWMLFECWPLLQVNVTESIYCNPLSRKNSQRREPFAFFITSLVLLIRSVSYILLI